MLLADGSSKPIEDLKHGDEVTATDPETGRSAPKPVTHLHVNQDRDLTDVTVRDTKTGKTTVLKTTQHHPFWDATDRKWVDAAKLTVGHRLLVHDDKRLEGDGTGAGMGGGGPGDELTVVEVRNFAGDKRMHDLTVADIHTYYVLAGTEPVLVHNNDDDCEVDVYRVEGAGNERVRIHEDGSVLIRGADKTLFLGFDDRDRAEAFLTKRLKQGFPDTVIKSFRVRREFLDYLREDKVPESMSKAFPTRPISVDHPAKDQYGLKPFNVKLMVEYIVPNSGKIG
ncbi:polymorphic toxin-type HINT domain-containing protein [Micromonospora peucetia]|uniref:polymorphic toxin-type HINT domain-containing protein n=1 Tax=Micromonospora peucetia TaxID=47871 RepID=UPI003316C6E8